MIRNTGLGHIPSWIHSTFMVDWPFYVLCATHGDIYFIPEPMAVHRPTGEGLWSSLSHLKKTEHWMDACLVVDRGLTYRFTDVLRPRALGFCYELAFLYQREGMPHEALDQMRAYWHLAPAFGCWKEKIRLLLGIKYPKLLKSIDTYRGRGVSEVVECK
jgi:hypothetical protein